MTRAALKTTVIKFSEGLLFEAKVGFCEGKGDRQASVKVFCAFDHRSEKNVPA